MSRSEGGKHPHIERLLRGEFQWVPYVRMRGCQGFVTEGKFGKFWRAYLNDRNLPIPPAQVYEDPDREGGYVIDDGHHRVIAAMYLSLKLLQLFREGKSMGSFVQMQRGVPVAMARFGHGTGQPISGGLYVDVITPTVGRVLTGRPTFPLREIRLDKGIHDKITNTGWASIEHPRDTFRSLAD